LLTITDIIAPRYVTLGYDEPTYLDPNTCCPTFLEFDASQSGTLTPLFPIIYVNQFECGWDWEIDPNDPNLGVLHALDVLQQAGLPDALFYTGHTNWVDDATDVANLIWPSGY
jgi:hypothetical protein